MGILSFWNRTDDFDLTAEDLATCEGYVSEEAFRRLEAAKASARRDAWSSLYGLARLMAERVLDAAARPAPSSAAAPTVATSSQASVPVISSEPASSSAPPPGYPRTDPGDRLDKAA